MNCIVTLFDGKCELPILGMSEGESVDLSDYECSCIHPSDLSRLKRLSRFPLFRDNLASLVDILEQGLEIHLWLKR